MDNLTLFLRFDTFPSGLGKRAGKLSLEATKMTTRILSVFNSLKRVGFAFLLLDYFSNSSFPFSISLSAENE